MVPRIPSWTKGVAVAVLPLRPPRPFVDKRSLRGQKVLQLQFSVSLRVPSWTKGVAVLQFSVSLRGSLRGQKVLQCSSPCPSVALRGQKVLQLQFSVSLRGSSWTKGVAVRVSLRGPSWTKGVAVAVLRVPPWPFVDKRCCSSAVLRVPPWPFVDKRCCSCSSPCPSVAFVDKRCCSCSSPCPSVALRGQKVLQFCSSPCPSVALRGQKVLQLQFSVSLRGPSWTKGVAVAVLRVPPWPFVDKRCCSCSSPCPSVALRGQKVLQLQFSVSLRGPSWTKVLQLQFSVSLRGPSWTKGVASSPWSSVALRGQKVLQLQFSVSLRGPSWTKGVAVLQFSVSLRGSSWTKGVAVAVLRVPPWIKKPFFLPYRVY